jgi:3-oxoacyl-[acyl-carrier protein] reductase
MDKIALITGSTRGIGKQIGIDLLHKGYFVYFNFAHDAESAKQLDYELINKYLLENFKIIKANLSSIKGAEILISNINKPLDVLIFNAGITDRTKFGEINLNKWYEVFNVNLNIPFYITQKLKDKINQTGKIIFISSISGLTTDSVSISYGVSKAAINMLVPYLAKEFKDKKITVNSVAPGYIDTSWHITKNKEQIDNIIKKCLANRLGTPEEVSKIVIAIIDNNFINGQCIRCDGGFNII